jgi:hypothetical protein
VGGLATIWRENGVAYLAGVERATPAFPRHIAIFINGIAFNSSATWRNFFVHYEVYHGFNGAASGVHTLAHGGSRRSILAAFDDTVAALDGSLALTAGVPLAVQARTARGVVFPCPYRHHY